MKNTEQASIRNLSDTNLLQRTQALVQEERKLGIQILHHLKEISRRRLHCELGFSSIFTYLVEHLKYPEASAYRLVNALKLLKELPEVEKKVEEKVESGVLSISTLSQVQSFCQAQKKENQIEIKAEEKIKVLASVEGCTRKETERVLASLYPEQPLSIPDQQRRISVHQTEIKITLDDTLLEKLDRIKQLISHQNLNPSYAELLDYLAEMVLDKMDPIRKEERKNRKEKTTFPGKFTPAPVDCKKMHRSRPVPAQTERQVWVQSDSRCAYISPLTGHRCTERKGLELNHIHPYGMGGSHELFNLELLCKQHNLQEAIKSYSPEKMAPFLTESG